MAKAARALCWEMRWNPDTSHVKGSYCSSLFNADEIPRNSNSQPNISQPNSLDVFNKGFCQTNSYHISVFQSASFLNLKNYLISHCVMVQFNLIVKSSRVLFIIFMKRKRQIINMWECDSWFVFQLCSRTNWWFSFLPFHGWKCCVYRVTECGFEDRCAVCVRCSYRWICGLLLTRQQ